MPEPDDVADLARLQRIAFGSGSSDSERADAARELEARPAGASGATGAGGPAGGEAAVEAGADEPGTPAAAAVDADGSARPVGPRTQRRWLQLLIGVGAAALVIGLVAGWQLGGRAFTAAEHAIATPTAFEGPRTMAEYLEAQPLAAETAATDVFLRPPTEADAAPLPPEFGFGNGALEYRHLATRDDGTAFYAARDASELCFVMVFAAAGGAASTCTADGRFPDAGLQLTGSFDGGQTPVGFDATFDADGVLSFRTVE